MISGFQSDLCRIPLPLFYLNLNGLYQMQHWLSGTAFLCDCVHSARKGCLYMFAKPSSGQDSRGDEAVGEGGGGVQVSLQHPLYPHAKASAPRESAIDEREKIRI